MKRHMILALLLAIGITSLAAPFRNIPTQVKQPDGRIVNCFASGDEFYNYLHDANGFTIVQGEGGYYCYATKNDEGKVIASPYIVDSVDPASVGLQPFAKISENEYQARRQAFEKDYHKPEMRNGKELNHGRYNNLVVFIRFAGDTYHNTPFSTVDAMFNATDYEANSLHNYYHHTSYNQLNLWSYFYPEPEGETILSYEDIYPKQYFQPYNPDTNPIGYVDEERSEREFSLLERAIAYIEDMVPDTLDLDYNDDGMVDNVVFVCKGETGAWNSLLWPHRWWIFDRTVMLHDLQVYDFNLQLEQGGYFNVSTLCHEMFHSLGAPDLYHYTGNNTSYPVDEWDLMCTNSDPPQQTNVYMKYKYGNWIEEIPTIDPWDAAANGFFELESVAWEGGRRNGYKIPTGDPDQFFLVEYRNKNNIFDHGIPQSGILIYLIDTRFHGNAGWDGNENLDEVYIFRPGGSPTDIGNIDHANFSKESKRTSFNYNTDPYPFIHNQPYQFYDPGFEITNISSTGDRMSFDFLPYGSEYSGPLITNFTAHVNSLEHQVELSWDAMPYADYYKVFCDGSGISAGITDTTFVYPYTDADNGYHTFSVMYVTGGLMHIYHAQTYTWVILGDFETIDIDISCDSDYGTKGGELEISFSDPEMKSQYFTVYEGTLKEGQLYVPANAEATFRWVTGFDPESNGIHVTAIKSNESGQETLFSIDHPTEGILATYTAAEGHTGVMPPQNLSATSEGTNVRLQWTQPTENSQFKIYRDGKPLASTVTGYEYLDENIMRSGTHSYQVACINGAASTMEPDNIVHATVMNYYCEPPLNLTGTHHADYDELQWEAPQFVGNGLIAYDDNVFVENFGSNNQKWGIIIEPVNLATFEGHPLTHLEMYDCSAGNYTFKVYNGEAANNSTLIHTQQQAMTGSNQMVRFALDEAVALDVTMPLWIAVESSGATHPIPGGRYVGDPNSCMLRSGSSWKPATYYHAYYTWLLRAYTSPLEDSNDFSYNVYWGPLEGGDSAMELGFENLSTNSVTHNSTENTRYYVTAIWNGRETDFSNTVCLGPSVEVESVLASHETKAFPNPTNDLLTIQHTNIQHIAIFNVTGQKVLEQTVSGDNVVISITSLPKGIYMMNVMTKEGNETVKVVKQ